ncbi:MAG: CRISPR-associated endonuclease Cas2, partial [Bacteroidota bacterium]
MPHLICYDITNNSLRTKMAKRIIEHGLDRINKSVYLGAIATQELADLEQKLSDYMNKDGDPDDSLLIIPVTAGQIQDMKIYGR